MNKVFKSTTKERTERQARLDNIILSKEQLIEKCGKEIPYYIINEALMTLTDYSETNIIFEWGRWIETTGCWISSNPDPNSKLYIVKASLLMNPEIKALAKELWDKVVQVDRIINDLGDAFEVVAKSAKKDLINLL